MLDSSSLHWGGFSWWSQQKNLAATWTLLGGHCLSHSFSESLVQLDAEEKSLCVRLQIHQYNIQWHRDPRRRPEYTYCFLLSAENKPAPARSLFYCFTTLESCHIILFETVNLSDNLLYTGPTFSTVCPSSWAFSHLFSLQNKEQEKRSYSSSLYLLLWVIVHSLINSIW